MSTDAKKLFDGVFGPNKPGKDLLHERRGIPVRLSAFDVTRIHRNMVEAFDEVVAIEKEMNALSWKMNQARRDFAACLEELEMRIHAQEEESNICGTGFRIYKPLGDEEDDRTTEV